MKKKKERIHLYRDNDALRYAKHDNKELFKIMEDLLTIAEAYVKVNAVKDYKRFFENPISYMIQAYTETWNDNLLEASEINVSQVNSLKERFDKYYDYLDGWNSAPIITKTSIVTGVKPTNFDLYCKPEKEQEYMVLCNFIEATRLFEEHFPTQSRKQICHFTDNLLGRDLHPQYHLFAEFIDK